jgi:hypothetical protein
VSLARDVGLDKDGVPAPFFDHLDSRSAFSNNDICHEHFGALLGKSQRSRSADT